MKQEQVIELAKKAGFDVTGLKDRVFIGASDESEWVNCSDEVLLLVKLVEQSVLERVADHFDKRGKNKDGEWCDGFYEPQEPGEIIRNLTKESQ